MFLRLPLVLSRSFVQAPTSRWALLNLKYLRDRLHWLEEQEFIVFLSILAKLVQALPKMWSPYGLAFLVLFSPSLADSALKKDQYCFDAVYEAYSDLVFEGNTPDDYWNMTCTNPLKLISMYSSGITYCTEKEINSGATVLAGYCMEYGPFELIPISDFAENLTAQQLQTIRVVDYEEIPATENITVPVMLSQSYYKASYRTIVCSILKIIAYSSNNTLRPLGSSKYGATTHMDLPCMVSGAQSF
jgi:hypothetical protein